MVLSKSRYTDQYLANMVPVYWQQIIVRGTTLHRSFDFEAHINGYRMTYTLLMYLHKRPFRFLSIISLFCNFTVPAKLLY
jgi:hypothetical protein